MYILRDMSLYERNSGFSRVCQHLHHSDGRERRARDKKGKKERQNDRKQKHQKGVKKQRKKEKRWERKGKERQKSNKRRQEEKEREERG